MTEAIAGTDLAGVAMRFALVLLRTGGLVVFCPLFSSEALPGRFRAAIAGALAIGMLPVVPAFDLPADGLVGFASAAFRETALGMGFGLAARAVFAGADAAAELVAGQSGFSLGSMVDPSTGESATAPVVFQGLFVGALFLAADLHHLLLRGVAASFELAPPASFTLDPSGLDRAVGLLGARMFAIAAQLAGPALVVTFAADLILVLMGRAVPQLQILSVGYPLKMVAGLVALGALAIASGAALGALGRAAAADAVAVFSALSGR